jgi:hypothetical protein
MWNKSNALIYKCRDSDITSTDVTEILNARCGLDKIGAIEQILFSFPLRNRTIYEGISQHIGLPQQDENDFSHLWGSNAAKKIGLGTYSENSLEERLNIFSLGIQEKYYDNPLLIPLSGGMDSRFLLGAIGAHPNIKTYTYQSGLSTETYVAKKIADAKNIKHKTIDLPTEIYKNDHLLLKHCGMVQLYHLAFISIANKLFSSEGDVKRLLVHGFMGDPIFGSKACMPKKKISADEEVENYLSLHLARYPFFSQHVRAAERMEILQDLSFEYKFYGCQDSVAGLAETLFITRRQQMIYKVIDCASQWVDIFTPFFDDCDLQKVALSIPQSERVSRAAFVRYCHEKFPSYEFGMNAENPFKLSEINANTLRRSSNYLQYLLEWGGINARVSPFQHEQLRFNFLKNSSYMQNHIGCAQNLLDIPLDISSSLSRSNNATDFGYSCATIGAAFNTALKVETH